MLDGQKSGSLKRTLVCFYGKFERERKKRNGFLKLYLKLFHHLVRISGRRRLWLDGEQSPRRLEHIAGAPMRRGPAQSGPGAAGYAAGLSGVLPSRTCSSKCKLGDGTTKTDS